MNRLDLNQVAKWVNENIGDFHSRRINSLKTLQLDRLLTKNPYLFRAKNVTRASDLIASFLEAFLSSSEEKLFGDFLEHLALYVAGITCGGQKSSGTGVDLDFTNEGVRYIVSVKSGPNWGNSAQHRELARNLQNAVAVVKQADARANVNAVLGICYGKTRTSYLNGYLKVVGQNFWYLISGNEDLYIDIIKPIGYRAKEHNEMFQKSRDALINKMTVEFVDRFCDTEGNIDWDKLVRANSGNFDMDAPPAVVQKGRLSRKP